MRGEGTPQHANKTGKQFVNDVGVNCCGYYCYDDDDDFSVMININIFIGKISIIIVIGIAMIIVIIIVIHVMTIVIIRRKSVEARGLPLPAFLPQGLTLN